MINENYTEADPHCKGCRWLGKAGAWFICSYALAKENGLRGCPPGEGCTRYEKKTHRTGPNLEARNARILQLYNEGKTDAEIAKLLGMGLTAVMYFRQQKRLKMNQRQRKQEVYRRQMKENKKREDLYWSGMTDGQIAAEEGVTDCAVAQWRKKRGLEVNMKGKPCRAVAERLGLPCEDAVAEEEPEKPEEPVQEPIVFQDEPMPGQEEKPAYGEINRLINENISLKNEMDKLVDELEDLRAQLNVALEKAGRLDRLRKQFDLVEQAILFFQKALEVIE